MTANNQSNQNDSTNEMPLISHLKELRTRLLRCLVITLIIFLALLYFSQDIYQIASEPLRRFLPDGASMIAIDPASAFLAPLKLTMAVALLLGMPFILSQIWGFIAPGLYKHEKRLALPLLAASVILFYLGMAFAYYIVFPVMFNFFLGQAPSDVTPMTDINSYLSFLTLLFAFGIAFEIPVATVLLVSINIVDIEYLKKIRPYVIVGCFVIGMILTPPDPMSQTLLAIPMWLLYEIGILFSKLLSQKEKELSN